MKPLTLQAVFILLPVSFFSLGGGTALLSLLIGDKLDSNTMVIALLSITIIIFALLGLAALWVEVINRIFFERSLMNKRLVNIPIHVGAIISALSILSLISLLIVPESKDTTGSLGLLSFGAPALIPYFYIMRNKNANKAIKKDV